ncbi:LysM peptidoglycan-binding domain-containing protein [Paenibacillus sp. 481]|uniref:LysM peptidoglycan-binding domain-containing protein n=1 Tax=Paenibacillus sp. 481 TaxID=2835869 RepID=UPI001E59CA75|nr:LysM peptidoglycan-binding domain-containing protein [Paenibacillus sp. 481]UHA73084.1 LysM peptidoglycan-binding domain-containing protein [Paenibacillus sp. 481]
MIYTTYRSIYEKTQIQSFEKISQGRKRMRRLRLLALMMMLMFVVCSGIVQAWGDTTQDDYVITYKKVIVQPGDTVWGIAKQYCPNEIDIRNYVSTIIKNNGIQNKVLQIGDTIHIPLLTPSINTSR